MQERTCVQDVEAATLEVAAQQVGAAGESWSAGGSEDAFGVYLVANEMKGVLAGELSGELDLFGEEEPARGIVGAAYEKRTQRLARRTRLRRGRRQRFRSKNKRGGCPVGRKDGD